MNPRIFLAGAAALFVVLLPSAASAAPAYPAADGRCVDEAEVLGADVCTRITERLQHDEDIYGDEIAVAIVPTTGDLNIKAWSTALFNKWGVGKRTENNGVLLVVAVEDRKVRLATGRGLIKRLDDASAKDIIDELIVPRFADEEYAEGILSGLDEVRRALGHKVTTRNALEPLASEAPSDEVEFAENEDGNFVSPDGGFVVGRDGQIISDDSSFDDGSSSTPVWPFALVGIGVVAALGFGLARAGSGGGGGGGGGYSGSGSSFVSRGSSSHHWSHTSSSHDSSSSSSSSSSSDSGSGSSFGGGSSDGGGSSSSW